MSLYLQLPIEMLHRPINCLTVYRSERFSVVNVAKLFNPNATRLSKVKVVCLASTSNCIYRYVSSQITSAVHIRGTYLLHRYALP